MFVQRVLGATRVALRRSVAGASRLPLVAPRPVAGLRSTLLTATAVPARGLATKAKTTRSRSVAKRAPSRTRAASPRAASKSRRARSTSRAASKSAGSRARSASARRAKAVRKAKDQKAKAKAKRLEERRERKLEKHQEAVARRAARRAHLRDLRYARIAKQKEHNAIVRENTRARKLVKREKEDAAKMFARLRVEAQNRGDPARPNRALSAYMLYSRSVFPTVYAETSAVDKAKGVSLAAKQIATQWKALSAEQKAPFEEQAKEEKVKQSAAREAYDATIPKQPATPFLRFSTEKRGDALAALPSLDGKSNKEKMAAVAAKLGEMWKALPDADKATYQTAYAAEKQKFEAAKEKYVNAQLELLPAEFREMVRAQLPGKVGEVGAWVGRVRELLAREAKATA